MLLGGNQSSFPGAFCSGRRCPICTRAMSERAVISELCSRAVLSVVEACRLGIRRFQQLGGLCHRHVVRGLWSGSPAGKYDKPARRNSLSGGPNRFVLSVDVSHELSDRLVRRELHSDFHRNAGIRNLSGGAVPDSVCPYVWDLCSLKDARPASGVCGLGHRPL